MKKLLQELNSLKIKSNPSKDDLYRIQEIEAILEKQEEIVKFEILEDGS